MILFSLCHASARLPDGWVPAAKDWFLKCDDPDSVEHLLVVPREGLVPLPGQPEFGGAGGEALEGSRGGTDQWNRAAWRSHGKVLIKLADDFFPCEHWDTELLRAIPSLDQPWVIEVDNQDNAHPLIAHAIITRSYYSQFGYLEHPDYSHNMADVEFTEVAIKSGRIVDARHLKFKHLNPEAGTAQWDDVYRRQRTAEARAQATALFKRREKAGFPKESMLEVAC